jgi:DNA-binding NtrC family response regulator
MSLSVWIVDDEAGLARGLARALTKEGREIQVEGTLAGMEERLKDSAPDVALLDLRLPDGSGLDGLTRLRQEAPEARVILMTAYGDTPTIVRAIREGAWNYIDKPFPLEAIRNLVDRAAESLTLNRRIGLLARGDRARPLGSSRAICRVAEFVERVAPHGDVNVLLTGESGSGKEVVARLLHELSGLTGDFVPLNCAALPETLLEAELFGARKGSYTGADQDRPGLAGLADGGTLFLDEIGDLPLPLQAKLLRFLDGRTYRPLGSPRERRVHLDVVCATCVDLEAKVREGTFRKDLYYRIAMLPLRIPPLRERERDVLELTEHFLREYGGGGKGSEAGGRGRRGFRGLSPEVEEVFLRYSWPGNVRELKNLLERLTILRDPGSLGDGLLRLSDLPEEMLRALPPEPEEEPTDEDRLEGDHLAPPEMEGTRNDGVGRNGRRGSPDELDLSAEGPAGGNGPAAHRDARTLEERMAAYEYGLLREELRRSGGNRTLAARRLGLSRFALLRRLQRHDLA